MLRPGVSLILPPSTVMDKEPRARARGGPCFPALWEAAPRPQGYPHQALEAHRSQEGTHRITAWVSAGLRAKGTPTANQFQTAKWREASFTEHGRVSKGDP